ncbi:MAG: haloacid dehalogenase type II [Dongiaceae bacterium]
MSSSRFRAVVFDAYGTLLDVDAAARRHRAALGSQEAALSQLWRRKQLEYSWLRSLMGRHADFLQVTGEALDFALDELRIGDGPEDRAELRARLLETYRRLDAYPEVAGALGAVRRLGLGTAILSNGTPDMLAEAVGTAGIGTLLDAILSAETVGTFKPHPSVYGLATRRFDCAPAAIAFVSSNGWDAAGAAAFGFHTVWINRRGAVREHLPAGPAAALPDLAGLADHLAGQG